MVPVTPEILAAFEFVESMVPRADGKFLAAPYWHSWALREAFLAGTKWLAVQQLERVPNSMNLTLESLCGAIKFFLKQIAEQPEKPVELPHELIIYGVPGDDVMKTLMELFQGTLKITVKELPAAMTPDFSSEVEGLNLWKPDYEHASPEDGAGEGSAPRDQDIGADPQPAAGGAAVADHR